jgi:DNA repair protein RecO (recombination protein O)
LTNNINKIKAIKVILYLLKQIQNDNYHNKIYNFVIKIINYLDEYDNYKKVLALYLIKMLYVFGINPSLNECVICKSKNNLVFFDLKEGGCYCNNHSMNSNIDRLNIWKEYYYDKKEFEEYSDTDFDQLLNEIFAYYNIHMSINLNNIMN